MSPKQKALRLIYFDKFLALPYPWNVEDKSAEGLLMEHKKLLDVLVDKRDDVDILFETGAGGSHFLTVEKKF